MIPNEWLDEIRSAACPFVPDIVTTGLCYAGLGYTTAIDAAIAPHSSRQARAEIRSMPVVDGNFLVLVGNESCLLKSIANHDQQRVDRSIQDVVNSTGAAGIKLVSPGNVNDWKLGWRERIHDIDQPLHQFSNTPRQIIRALAKAADAVGLSHPLHIHCNALGMPGNWQTTLATMQAVGQCRGHFAHIQFHSYRGADDEVNFGSAVDPLVEYVNGHPNLTVDVGQVMFGNTMAMTGDSPLAWYLQQISGQPWISHDVHEEGGCGVLPVRYRCKDRIHALQWAIGLEWMLKINDPWRLALSTDHPNGASFLAYPQIIALLMDADLRHEQIKNLHPSVFSGSGLAGLDRQYSLEEIAIITRAAPARILGLSDKGHLGPGATADITIYNPHPDRRKMFQLPRTVIKSGEVVVDDGQLAAAAWNLPAA
jgi:formylmethanofuran dehydrogenase subunit A